MNAEIGTPAGSSHAASTDGHCDVGAVKRALGWAAGVVLAGVHGLPRQSVSCAGGSLVSPSHQTSPSSVRATLVKMQFRSTVAMALGLVSFDVPGRDAEEARFGVDGVEPAVLPRLDPGDVVADGGDLPAVVALGRDEHREVGLAAGAGEARRDVGLLALRVFHAHDQGVLGHPPLVAGHDRGDAQREALLAEQRVAAVPRPVRPDLPLLGEVDDVLLVVVAGPLHVRLAAARAACRPNARTARNRDRRARPAPPGPCES